MAKTIPQLTDATTVNASDELIIQQSGITKRATASELLNSSAIVTATGSTTARSLAARAADVVNVKDFGAVGDGATDDTTAIQAAIAHAQTQTQRCLYFPTGTYKISSPLTITGSQWEIYGDGSSVSILKTSANDDILRLDRTAGGMNRGEIRNLGFDREFILPYTNSCGIRVVSDQNSGGIYAWKFTHLQFQHLYRCIRFNRTAKVLWLGVPSIEAHSYCRFTEITVLDSTGFQPLECITFDEGCGPHHTILGGKLFASGAQSACIKIGDGGTNNGFGDLIIEGVHITNSETGIKFIGPSGAGIYNQNIVVSGCQFDGDGMSKSIEAIRMSNCRFFPNNSSSVALLTLTSCSNIAFGNEQNIYFLPTNITGSTARYSNGVTFGSTTQTHTATGYNVDETNWSADTLGSIRTVSKSRGASVGSHAAVQAGDTLGEERFSGSDGTAFKIGAQIVASVAAAPSSGDAYISTSYSIRTSPDGANSPKNRIVADGFGNVTLRSYGQSTATNATNGFVHIQKMDGAPTGTPDSGNRLSGTVPMIIDETNSRIYVYLAGNWKYTQLS